MLKINEKILRGGIENAEKFSTCLKESIKRLFKNENSDLAISTNRQIILATKYVAADAIACNAIDIIKMILIIYENFTSDNGPSDPVYYNDLYDSLAFVLIRAIKANKQELVDIILNTINQIRFSLEFTKGFNNTQLLSNLYVSILYSILLMGTDDTWKYYRQIHNDLTGLIIHANKIQEVEYPCLMLQAFVRREDFCKNSKAQELYYELLQNLIRTRNTYANIEIVRFVNTSLQYFGDKNFGNLSLIRESKFTLAYNSLKFIEDVPSSLMPNFKEFAEKSDKLEEQREYSYYCKELIVQCISKKMVNNLKTLLHDLVDILSNFDQSQKEFQRIWMQIFYIAFDYASHDGSIYELILYMYINAIREMDKKRRISEKLALEVINELRKLCVGRYRENVDFVCEVVELLDRLASEDEHLYFVSHYRLYKEIYACISDIGIDGIEKNQPLVIKRVSNLIGWRLYGAIKDNEADLAKQLLTRAFDLFELCKFNLPDDRQTIVFVGTLFVIIGAYCKENRKIQYLNKIVDFLKKCDCFEYINVSKMLRQRSGDNWNIIGKDPNTAMNEFIKLLK